MKCKWLNSETGYIYIYHTVRSNLNNNFSLKSEIIKVNSSLKYGINFFITSFLCTVFVCVCVQILRYKDKYSSQKNINNVLK
jgi:hypothetical protein